MNVEELAETGAVDYLVLNLMVAQTIVTLKKYYFEHEYYIYRLAACRRLALLGQQHIFKNRAEHLEVHQRGESFQGIAHLGESFYCKLLLEQALAHRGLRYIVGLSIIMPDLCRKGKTFPAIRQTSY